MTFILEFKPISLQDKELFDKYFHARVYYGSETSFSCMFIWQGCYGIYWTLSHGALIMKAGKADSNFFLPPFGAKDEDLPAIVEELREYNGGRPVEMHGIYDEFREQLERVFPAALEFEEERDSEDYIYAADKLATLSGRKLHAKKNHANAFRRENPDYVYESIAPGNIEECLAFAKNWCEHKVSEDEEDLLCEFCAIKVALHNFDALGLRGGIIRIKGKVEAFTFGEEQNAEMAHIHVEKANPDIRGLYAVINQEFIRHEFSHLRLVNREEDMGLAGLRQAKESYNPEFMVRKFNTVIR